MSRPDFARHVGKGAIVIVVVELRRGRAMSLDMPGPVLTVDEQYVGPAIVVVIDESATWAHGFGQPLFSEGSVVVSEVDAGLGGDIAEGDFLLRVARGGHREDE